MSEIFQYYNNEISDFVSGSWIVFLPAKHSFLMIFQWCFHNVVLSTILWECRIVYVLAGICRFLVPCFLFRFGYNWCMDCLLQSQATSGEWNQNSIFFVPQGRIISVYGKNSSLTIDFCNLNR